MIFSDMNVRIAADPSPEIIVGAAGGHEIISSVESPCVTSCVASYLKSSSRDDLLNNLVMTHQMTVVAIVVAVAAAIGALSLPGVIAVLGFQYTFWRMHLILDNVPENELIDRTKDLPEVKAFLEKYGETRPYIMTDYHVDVIYDKTECELTGEYCSVAHPFAAYLDIRISLDTGFPQHSSFSCDGGGGGKKYPIGDKALLQHINDC